VSSASCIVNIGN